MTSRTFANHRQPVARVAYLLTTLLLLMLSFSAVVAQTPFITITNPVAGANLPNASSGVIVEGRAGNLGDVITIQALDRNNQVIAQTTTNNPGGADGPWAATLVVVYDGPGKIVALSGNRSTGSVDAWFEIDVNFGIDPGFGVPVPTTVPPAPSPFILISSPVNGEQLPNAASGVSVSGRAGNLNDVITVQVLDNNGTVVAQAVTNNPGSADGPWAAFLPVAYVGPGRISAFSGNQVAEVQVFFGRTSETASITITNPTNGGVADATSGAIRISGTAVNVFENNVVVQVRDALSRTMQQSATTADRQGNWNVSIGYLVENGTQGSIRAFSTSPVDGSVTAESIINVTFSSNCAVNSEWPTYTVQSGDTLLSIATRTGSTVAELTEANCLPNPSRIFSDQVLYVPRLPVDGVEGPISVEFTSPAADGIVDGAGTITVSGATTGVAEGNTFVRIIGPLAGDVFDEQAVTVTREAVDGRWEWQAQLDMAGVPVGTRLTLYAYAVNGSNGRVLDADARQVSYGAVAQGPFITITSPLPYSQLDEAAVGIVVNGRAGNLNDVIYVRAVDENNQILAEVTTNNPGGADGEWAVQLPVPTLSRGRIVALSGNRETQSIDAWTEIDVVFGNPAENPTFALITYPLPNAIITSDAPYVIIAGEVQGAFNDRVAVNVLDENGNILLVLTAEVNPETGVWTATTTANANIVNARRLSLQVVATTPEGSLLAADRIGISTRPTN